MTTVVRQIQDRRFWLEFIKEYKSLPCLWDVKHSNYGNRKIRDSALFMLLKKLRVVWPEANLDVVKQRLNNFRRTFLNEYNKVQESKKDGTIYTPSLYYYNHLKFLKENYDEISETEEEIGDRNKYNPIDEKDAIEELTEEVGYITSSKSEILPLHDYSTIKSEEEPRPKKRQRYIHEISENPVDTIVDTTEDEEEDLQIADSSGINTMGLQLVEKTRPDDDFSEVEVLSEISANAVFTSQCHAEDEFDVIAKRVATHFRNMEPQQCLYAEKLVFDVCISGRLNRLTEDSNLKHRSCNENSSSCNH